MHYEEQEYSKRIDLKTIKKLAVFAKPYKKGIITLIIQMVFLAFVDAVFPKLSQYAIDNFAVKQTLDGFWLYCLLAIAMVVAQAFNVWLMIKNAGAIENKIPYDIRKAAFQKLQELSIAYYDKTPVGWLMARLTSDVKRLGVTLSWHVVDFFWAIFLVVLMTIFMLFTNVGYALLVLSVVPLLVVISMVFQKKI